MSETSTVVVTRLETTGLSGVRGVLRATAAVVADCQAVPGFLGGRLAIDPRGNAWTLTVWDSPSALRAFGIRHGPVAATIDEVARSSDMAAFRQDGRSIPSWAQAAAHTSLGRPGRPALQRPITGARVPEGAPASSR